MDTDLDTLATALYVKIDDELKMRPELRRFRPEVGLCPKLADAELLTLAVIQALLGFGSETRFLRHASVHLRHLSPSFSILMCLARFGLPPAPPWFPLICVGASPGAVLSREPWARVEAPPSIPPPSGCDMGGLSEHFVGVVTSRGV